MVKNKLIYKMAVSACSLHCQTVDVVSSVSFYLHVILNGINRDGDKDIIQLAKILVHAIFA